MPIDPHCGGVNQPPCAPVPTTAAPHYTAEEMSAYGQACYQRGITDQRSVQKYKDTHGHAGGL